MSHVVRALLFKEMREGRWKYFIAAAVLIALGVSIPVMYQFVVDMLDTLMHDGTVPPALQELISPDVLELSAYLWGNWHTKNLYQAMVVIAIIIGSGAIAGEFSRGSAQFLFSRAVPRESVVLVKAGVDMAGMAAAALLGTVALDVAARIVHGFAVSGTFYAALIPIMAGTAFVYALALFASTKIDDPVKAGVAAAMAAAPLSVPSFVPAWRGWSVYIHMTGRALLEGGTFPWASVLVLAALAAGLMTVAIRSVRQRDI